MGTLLTHKKCSGKRSRCGLVKPINDFQRCGTTRSGKPAWRAECKECRKLYYQDNKQVFAARKKTYRSKPENQEKEKAYAIEYRKDREKGREIERRYYEKHEEQVKTRRRAYRKRPEVQARRRQLQKSPTRKARIREYERKKKQTDPAFRIRKNISIHVNHMLQSQGARKAKSFLEAIDYTMDQLKAHLESLFETWMNWDNYGPYRANKWDDTNQATWTWQIDHIVPQSDLPYTSLDDENFKECWKLENLRPFSAKRNLLDGVNRTRHDH